MQSLDANIILIPLAAVIAPILAALFKRFILIPLVIFEVALGILLGPDGFALITDSEILEMLSKLGLAALFFMAGNEIDTKSFKGQSGLKAILGWFLSAFLALVFGILFLGVSEGAVLLAIALTGTALGTITPIMRDAGILKSQLGKVVGGLGAVGEFAPLIAISIFFSGKGIIASIGELIFFVIVLFFIFSYAKKGKTKILRRLVSATLHTSAQFAIRFLIFLLAALVTLSAFLGVDFLLGAFTAGMLSRVLLKDVVPEELSLIETKLESVSFGFFVPIFFITTGVTFPLHTLITNERALLLVPVFTVIMFFVRGLPGWISAGRGTSLHEKKSVALFTATTLPLVIAVVGIAQNSGSLNDDISASLMGAAMLTVMFFPMIALLGHKQK